jgi:hypothetical protein
VVYALISCIIQILTPTPTIKLGAAQRLLQSVKTKLVFNADKEMSSKITATDIVTQWRNLDESL